MPPGTQCLTDWDFSMEVWTDSLIRLRFTYDKFALGFFIPFGWIVGVPAFFYQAYKTFGAQKINNMKKQ